MSRKKSVLVVEDETLFLNSLKKALEEQGFLVTPAGDGKRARDIFASGEFDCVLTDINLPHLSGIALMKYVKEVRPQVPVILMTGFSVLEETRQADELGAAGFIAKPFLRADLIAIFDKVLPKEMVKKIEAPPEPMESQYAKVRIDDFISGKQIKFDIFVRLSGEKFVKIAMSGEDISVERIRMYKTKGLHFLYLRKEDFEKYLEMNLVIAKAVTSNASVPKEKSIRFLKHANDVVMEHLHFNEIDPTSFESAKVVLEATLNVCSSNAEMTDLLGALNSHDNTLYAHSLGVSLYSVMIAEAMDWKATATLNKIGLGGLFHDIGKKEINPEILSKPRKNFTHDEIKLYESHPFRGVEILSSVGGIPDDILQMVLQHHEDCIGTGYPSRLQKAQIHPMARVIAVADAFCTLAVRTPNTEPMPPVAAVKRLMMLKSATLDHACLNALAKIFKVEPLAKAAG